MKGPEALQGGIYLAVLPGTKYFELLVDKKEQNFSLEVDTADFVGSMKVSNSPANTLFNQYQRFLTPRQKNLAKLSKELAQLDTLKADSLEKQKVRDKMKVSEDELNDYRKKVITEQPTSFLAKIFTTMQEPEIPAEPKNDKGEPIDKDFRFNYFHQHFLDNVDFSDDRLVKTPLLYNKINTYLEKLTYRIPDSVIKACDMLVEKSLANKEVFKYVLSYLTYTYETSKIMGYDVVFVHLAEKYYLPGKAFWMDEKKMDKVRERVTKLSPTLIGKKAPEINAQSVVSGQMKSLHGVQADYTVMLFWSHNCGHCKESMPKFIKLYEKFKNKGVEMFSIETETKTDEIKKFIEEKKIPFDVVYDPTNATRFRELYDIYSTPVSLVLDKDKKILAKRIDVEQIEKMLDSLIEEKQKGEKK